MEDLLREFLELALEEMRNPRVPNQLLSSKSKKSRKSKKKDEEDKNEMSTVGISLGGASTPGGAPGPGGYGGYTAPLGSSSADMKSGKHATPGKKVKVKKRKKDYVRIK